MEGFNMKTLEHNCFKRPDDALFDEIHRDEKGNWSVTRTSIYGGVFRRLEEPKKIAELSDGRCPWCNVNLTWLAEVWPHECKKAGQGARELILKAADMPTKIDLAIDREEPTRAVYTVTFKLYVKECPDCGTKLFE
ncbi:MAG TPA: hypothetical protein VJK04_02915 [Candidatus Paceibacterota bacterium]